MRTDVYTKTVLTVIAVCLVWMCVTASTPVAWAFQAARPQPAPVMLVDANGAPLVTPEGLRVNLGVKALPVMTVNNAPLPVVVSNPSIAVSLRSIQRGAAWDAVPVQVLREPPTLRPTP